MGATAFCRSGFSRDRWKFPGKVPINVATWSWCTDVRSGDAFKVEIVDYH